MDNMDYLNQISRTAAPTPKRQKLLSPLMLKLLIGGAVIFILLIIVGSLLGSLADKPITLAKQLDLRLTDLNTMLSENSDNIKNPSLRSLSTSMAGSFQNTTRDLSAYLSAKDGFNVEEPPSDLASAEADGTGEFEGRGFTSILDSLEDARLNAQFDPTFSRIMNLELVHLISMESEILERSKDNDLNSIISDSKSSLENIRPSLEQYLSE